MNPSLRTQLTKLVIFIFLITSVESINFLKIISTINDVIDTGRTITGFLEDTLSTSNSNSLRKHSSVLRLQSDNGRTLFDDYDIDNVDFYPFTSKLAIRHVDEYVEKKYSHQRGLAAIVLDTEDLERDFNMTRKETIVSEDCEESVEIKINNEGFIVKERFRPYESLHTIKRILNKGNPQFYSSNLDLERELYFPICILSDSNRYLSSVRISPLRAIDLPTVSANYTSDGTSDVKILTNTFGQLVKAFAVNDGEGIFMGEYSAVTYVCSKSTFTIPRSKFSLLYLINPCSGLLCSEDGKMFNDIAKIWNGLKVYQCPKSYNNILPEVPSDFKMIPSACPKGASIFLSRDLSSTYNTYSFNTILGELFICVRGSASVTFSLLRDAFDTFYFYPTVGSNLAASVLQAVTLGTTGTHSCCYPTSSDTTGLRYNCGLCYLHSA